MSKSSVIKQLKAWQPDAQEVSVDVYRVTLELESGRQQAAYLQFMHAVKEENGVYYGDSNGELYPIKCDYVGITLSTTLKDRVEINFDESNYNAYLV
jgi:hypothetical protein